MSVPVPPFVYPCFEPSLLSLALSLSQPTISLSCSQPSPSDFCRVQDECLFGVLQKRFLVSIHPTATRFWNLEINNPASVPLFSPLHSLLLRTLLPSCFTRSTLAGIPPFHVPNPAQDQRCQVIAVERRLLELVRRWNLPLSPEVSRKKNRRPSGSCIP